ncbi:MAG: hypothetical protein KAI79_14880 [Bacteroidales bacterium]|nr:hypothetical protein [Bacteroidales bacterium]
MSSVFISGSIAIKKIPLSVENSINKIIDQNIQILVGDADGIDTKIQNYCKRRNYSNVIVYSIYPLPRYKVPDFEKKYIVVNIDSKKERERQKEKDAAMTIDSDYSLVIWDGVSKGSYQNILRAIEKDKKVKVYLNQENKFLDPNKIKVDEIEYTFRKNNGYTAKEVIEYLINEGEDYFQQTRAFNKCLLDNKIIKKEDGVYLPTPQYKKLFIIDKYRGKIKGIKFNNDFINWVEKWIKDIKPPEELSMF